MYMYIFINSFRRLQSSRKILPSQEHVNAVVRGIQWNDTDGDGYGDNLSGNDPDTCPYEWGNSTSTYVPEIANDGTLTLTYSVKEKLMEQFILVLVKNLVHYLFVHNLMKMILNVIECYQRFILVIMIIF